jgi:hypothetical protein
MIEAIETTLQIFCDRRPILWAYLTQAVDRDFVWNPRVFAWCYRVQFLECCLEKGYRVE